VDSVLDGRLLLGLACLAVWAALVVLAWRRGRRVEAFAVGWIAIALLPVANLVMPVGVVVAERALYLPSAGFVFALATWLERVARRRVALVLTVLGLAGAASCASRACGTRPTRRAPGGMQPPPTRCWRALSGWSRREALLRDDRRTPRDGRPVRRSSGDGGPGGWIHRRSPDPGPCVLDRARPGSVRDRSRRRGSGPGGGRAHDGRTAGSAALPHGRGSRSAGDRDPRRRGVLRYASRRAP